MQVNKILTLKNNILKTYRNCKLYKDTPPIIRDIYVNRQGYISELKNKYGSKSVENSFASRDICSKSADMWIITDTGKENIELFHTKPSIWESFVSVQFALLAKMLK